MYIFYAYAWTPLLVDMYSLNPLGTDLDRNRIQVTSVNINNLNIYIYMWRICIPPAIAWES